ncbi:MAG: BatA and WFA domain-containing protein [Bacteroidetes bacterium]|nr:BatA and WFA domain-containing protein [Bacteroidota bacterium]MCB0844539.1 BatA and WFA domain-containing protein [Bacteroidota bacterium]
MAFLFPGILWGLLALSVPIIVHFFNLQRPKQILFSNVAFVKEVKKSVVRRLKFKQWLLLLLRLLAISALVLAFASPVIVSENQKVLRGNRSVGIIIDNSYSMTARNERGQYFQQAISLARNILSNYSNEDEFLLMTTSNLKLNYGFYQQEEALAELKDLAISQNIRSQEDILNFRNEIFSRAGNGLQELYFLSDFQKSTVMADSQRVNMDDTSLIIKYIPLATREQKNVYIRDHEIISQIIEKDKPVQMNLTMVNDGNTAINDLNARVVIEGKVAAISNNNLEPQSTQNLEISFTPPQSGWVSGFVELDDNWVDFDNKRYFSFYVPEAENVLIVEGETSRNVRILYESLFTQFAVKFISARNISTVELNDYRSVVLLGVKEISSGLGDKLRTFLDEGGSIMFFPAEEMELSGVNSFLSSVNLGRFEPTISIEEGIKASLVDLAHPIFEGIYNRHQNNREFDAPNVYKYYPLVLNNSTIQNRIIALENQSPVMVETKVGKGIMFTFSIFPGDAWTDLHVRTIFTPLMFRATQIMNQTQNVQMGQDIGFFKPKTIRTNLKSLINLVGEDGRAIPPEQYAQGGVTVLNFENMDLKEGNYDITQEDKLLEKMSFNISDLESSLDFLSSSELENTLEQSGYDNIKIFSPNAESIKDQIEEEKEGIPLWKYFIILALLCLAGEILILRLKDQPVS